MRFTEDELAELYDVATGRALSPDPNWLADKAALAVREIWALRIETDQLRAVLERKRYRWWHLHRSS